MTRGYDERRDSDALARLALRFPSAGYTLGTLADELGDGVYTWTRFDPGSGQPKPIGPKSGRATELNATTGLAAGTNVLLRAAAGKWWFRNPRGGTSTGGGGITEWYGDGSDGDVAFDPADLVDDPTGRVLDGDGNPVKYLLSPLSDPAASPTNTSGLDVLAVAWQGSDLDPSGTWPEIVAGDWYFFLQRAVFGDAPTVPSGSHVVPNGAMILAKQSLSGAGEITGSGAVFMPSATNLNSPYQASIKFRLQTGSGVFYNPCTTGTPLNSFGNTTNGVLGGFNQWKCQPGGASVFSRNLGGAAVGFNGPGVSVPAVSAVSVDQPPPFDEVSSSSLNSGSGGGASNAAGAPAGTFAGGTGNGWGFPGGHSVHSLPAAAGQSVSVRPENGLTPGLARGGTAGGAGAGAVGWGNPGFGGNQVYQNSGTGTGGLGGAPVVVRAKTISGSLKLASNGADGEPAYQPTGSFFGLPASPAGGGGGGNPGYILVVSDSASGITFSHTPGNGGAGIGGGSAGAAAGGLGYHAVVAP